MNIGFDFYCDETPLLFEASKLFHDNINIFGVSMGQRYKEYWQGINSVHSISNYIEEYWNDINISIESIKEIEERYRITNLSFFIISDRYLCKLDYEYSLKILIGNFLFYEDFFKTNKIDVFIDTPAAILSQLVCYHVAKKNSVKYLAIRVTRNKNPTFTFINDWQDNWYRMIETYKKDNFDKNSLNEAKNEYLDFINIDSKPSYMSAPKQFNKIQLVFIKEFYKRLKKYYLDKQYLDKYDYITQNPFWYVNRDLKKIMRSKYQNIIHSKIFDNVDISKPYYLFPLHLQPEASTLMMAPNYVNQIATIENIAKTLPGGHYLYVKEHTSSYGIHNNEFYSKIKSISNVKLISPFFNTRQLINNCIAPIVLTSTVGWEALLLGKPVVVLGEVFYNSSGLTYHVKKIDDLSEVLSKQIILYKLNKDKLFKFISAINMTSYKGNFSPATFREKEILSNENIFDIYYGIKKEINNAIQN